MVLSFPMPYHANIREDTLVYEHSTNSHDR